MRLTFGILQENQFIAARKALEFLSMADKTIGELKNFTLSDFDCLVFKNVLPKEKKGVSYLTFGFFDLLFDFCEESRSKGLISNQNETVQNVIERVSGLDRSLLGKCSSFTYVRNLKKKVKAKLKKDISGEFRNVLVKDFSRLLEQSEARGQTGEVDLEPEREGKSFSLGPACKALGISSVLLFDLLANSDALKKHNFTKIKLSNEIV